MMLEARNVTFGYPGSAKLLYEGLSLAVRTGERVELRAPSGWGKTTLCRMLAGFEQPLSGEVLIGGAPHSKRGVSPVQLILQHPELAVDPRMRMVDVLGEALGGRAEGPAGERELLGGDEAKHGGLVARGKRARGGAAAGAAARARALAEDPEVARVVEGLGIRAAWMSRYPHELSGGELQRFCVARALLAEPRFLVADEISTMLDAVTQAQIWQFILEDIERNSRGLVFVSHSPALSARIATRTVHLAP